MIVRRATPADARSIAEIHVRAWRSAYRDIVPREVLDALSVDNRERFWRRALDARRSEVWVAGAPGQIVGWISVGPCRDPDASARMGEIWAIYVDPAHWRRAIGRCLWEEARAHLTHAGYADAIVWVFEQNAGALAFYRSLGFVVEHPHTSVERGDARLAEVRLRRVLEGRG
jgi:L-amino acid N-acyltransferase YncA